MDVLQLQTALGRYLKIKPEGSKAIATYIFVNYYGSICAKSRTLSKEPASIHGKKNIFPDHMLRGHVDSSK